ncbi:MAG: hypothetical protein IJ509_03735 [Bacilli bacterium]|nr:hypothetical protein [Bacilli bacterium]
MNEQNEKKNIIYAAIGVLTLIVATVGATFAYYTATKSVNTVITGNMATITFDLSVTKVTSAGDTSGLIPMSNSMVESAVSNASTKGICVDDNNNAVCQIYKINVENTGTASMFLDGYVTLTGGSGTPTDWNNYGSNTATTMRWAQVFCTNDTNNVVTGCTTAGVTTTTATKSDNGVANGITSAWAVIENTTQGEGKNTGQILDNADTITTKATISGNDYDVINTNYIRVSNHASASGYKQADDKTSALVYNEYLYPEDDTANPTGGSTATYTDSQVYYIVVWLSETGTNQTANVPSGTNTTTGASTKLIDFFNGNVTFVSAQGSEVTARFAGWTSVNPDTKLAG